MNLSVQKDSMHLFVMLKADRQEVERSIVASLWSFFLKDENWHIALKATA